MQIFRHKGAIILDILEKQYEATMQKKLKKTCTFCRKFSDPKGETVTRGSLYKFAKLNSPELSHRGKTIISPNW